MPAAAGRGGDNLKGERLTGRQPFPLALIRFVV